MLSTINLVPSFTGAAPVSTVQRAAAPLMREAMYKPGATAPAYLDGTMPADAGCDPLCLVALACPVGVTPTERYELATGSFVDRIAPFPWSVKLREKIWSMRTPEEQKLTLQWQREAEIKHGRLAMLAVIGWPLSELVNPMGALGFTNGRAPSLFNGGLDAYAPFMLLVAAGSIYAEMQNVANVNQMWCDPEEYKKTYVPGDLKFDPLGLAEKAPMDVATAEIYNGRLAMLAITGFAVQEFVWGAPVVSLPISGFFFGR